MALVSGRGRAATRLGHVAHQDEAQLLLLDRGAQLADEADQRGMAEAAVAPEVQQLIAGPRYGQRHRPLQAAGAVSAHRRGRRFGRGSQGAPQRRQGGDAAVSGASVGIRGQEKQRWDPEHSHRPEHSRPSVQWPRLGARAPGRRPIIAGPCLSARPSPWPPHGRITERRTSRSACWSSRWWTTRSTSSTCAAGCPAGTWAPSASTAMRPRRSWAVTSRCSSPTRIRRATSPPACWNPPAATGATRTRAGACARTAPASGPTAC